MTFDPVDAALDRSASRPEGAALWAPAWTDGFEPRGDDVADTLLRFDGGDAVEAQVDVLAVARIAGVSTRASAATRRAVGVATSASGEQLGEWMRRIVERDDKALAALYDACASRVFALVLRILPRHQQAEEVVEDCFWQVWREAPRYDVARGPVLGWILAIARNRAIDALRRHHVCGRHEVPFDDLLHDQLHGPDDAPGDVVETAQRDHGLHLLLSKMDPMQRQMLSLAFFRGFTHQEIAVHSGLALGTVKSHLRRALALLRERCVAAGVAPGIQET